MVLDRRMTLRTLSSVKNVIRLVQQLQLGGRLVKVVVLEITF